MENLIVGLADAIEALRAELTTAIERSGNQAIQFKLDPINLTVQAAITRDGKGNIGWGVFGLGASYESASTQTLTIRLTPAWRRPDGSLDTDFTVAAQGPAGQQFGPAASSGGDLEDS